MIEFLKGAVTGLKTARFKDGDFDLDLTYITDRIIAMSFPGSGLETIYRNSITDVSKLLQKHHGSNYMVLNLSGLKYEYSKFDYQVQDFPWEDHHSPPISLLFEACQCIHNFLRADPRNVVAIHCLAGKGRTGTIIVSYLLFCGRFETSEQALEYYKRKRFHENGGVTQPSQIRAVKYFEKVLNSYLSLNKMYEPVIVQIEKMTLHGVPQFTSGAFKPIIKIYSVQDKGLLYSSDLVTKPIEYYAKDFSKIDLPLGPKSPILTGDVLIKVYHMPTLGGNKKAFRLAFNTSMLNINTDMTAILRLPLNEIDPHEIKKDDRFPLSFTVDVCFKILCKGTEFNSESWKYAEHYEKDFAGWEKIYEILKRYKVPPKKESSLLLFKTLERDDVDKRLGRKSEKVNIDDHDWELIEGN